MTAEEFYHIKELERAKSWFIEKGWITIYDSQDTSDDKITNSCLIYGYTIDEKLAIKCMSNYPSDIERNERVAVFGDNSYKSFAKDGIEPLICAKSFQLPDKRCFYIDVSEEFISYFNLYEVIKDKQNRKYYYIDSSGELEEVIIVIEKKVRFKLKYLVEYLAIRQRHLILWFMFETQIPLDKMSEMEITYDTGTLIPGENYIYENLVRVVPGIAIFQSWQQGKVILKHKDINDIGCHYNYASKYAEFIVGFDNETGHEILLSCDRKNENYLKVTYFKKEVLDKYYNAPEYCFVDGFRVSTNFFSLKIDNNNFDYVAVFLVNLSSLPYKEQLYWKSFNIAPTDTMSLSKTYYQTMIEGRWVNGSEMPDLVFKERFKEFSHLWNKKFGWDLFKPLDKIQTHVFTSLHIPTTNNISTFCNMIESLTLILIDSLNDSEITKKIELAKDDRSITKFEKFLAINHKQTPELIEFFRNLQTLRSGMTKTHRFSKKALTAMAYFNINDNYSNLTDVAKNIYLKAICTLNTLLEKFVK